MATESKQQHPVSSSLRLLLLTLLGAAALVGVQAGAASASPVVTDSIPTGSFPRNVAVSPDGSRAYVTNSGAGSNSVLVVDTATYTPVTTISGFSEPYGVAVSPDGSRAYVTNSGNNTVAVINTADNTILAAIPVGSQPLGVAVSPDGSRVYVNTVTTVSVINTATNAVSATIPGFSLSDSLAVSPDGMRVYVVDRGVPTMSVIDTATHTVTTTVGVGNWSRGVAVSPDGSRAYVSNNASGSVSVIDTATNTVTTTIGGLNGPNGIAVSPDGTRTYVTTADKLSVIDNATNTVSTVSGFNSLWGLAVSPDGSRAYATEVLTNFLSEVALQPSPPTAVAASPGVNKVNVSWQAPSFTGGQPITSYTATAAPGGKTCVIATTSCVIDGLTPGTPYTVTVRATNSIGTSMASAASDPATPTTPSHIVIKKLTNPASDTTTDFTFDPSWSTDDIALRNNGSKDTVLDPGNYSIVEKPLAGWDLTSATCDNGNSVDAIRLAAGQTVTCTFTNTQRGHIIVKKTTEPGDGEPEFSFDPSWGDEFGVKNGGQHDSGALEPGTYSVTENPLFGWELRTSVCSGQGNTPDQITLGAGQTVTCTFTNDKQTAQLRLQKKVDGGNAKPEDWSLSATASTPYEGKNIENAPGNNTEYATVYADVDYDLSESDGPAHYTPGETWECVSDSRPTAVQPDLAQDANVVRLDPGEQVTCTITNTRDTAELRLVKQVEGKNSPNDWTLTAKAAPDHDLDVSTPGGSGAYAKVYAGIEYTLAETGPDGYTAGTWQCESSAVVPAMVRAGDTITLEKGERVTCTITNTRDTGSLTISKEFNPQNSGFAGTFDINYACLDGGDPAKSGTVTLGAGKSETVSGLPTGSVCTVSEQNLPVPPNGWAFNQPTFAPGAQVTIGKDPASVTVTNSISQLQPVTVKRPCPINVTKGGKSLIKKVKTNANCVVVKPVVLCRPLGSSAAGETAFCDVVSKRGRVTVKTSGYDKVRVRVIVRAAPKPGHKDRWQRNTWRKTWVLRG